MVLGFLLHVFLGELLGVGSIFPVTLGIGIFGHGGSTLVDACAWEIVIFSLLLPYLARPDLAGPAALWLERVGPWTALRIALAVFAINYLASDIIHAVLGTPDSTPDDRIDQEFEDLQKHPLGYALFALIVVVLGPVIEELVFRGLIQTHVRAKLGPALGIAISGALFGLLHGGPPPYAASLVFTGIVLGILREKTGGVTVPIAAHIVHNTLATALG